MFKVLPQMRRLADQVCLRYGFEIEAVILEQETDAAGAHKPHYIMKLKSNPWGYVYLSCRPHKGQRGEHSKSINNVTVVLISITAAGPLYEVVPSWRGYLIPEGEVNGLHYYARRGYMLMSVGADYVEQCAVNAYEGRRII